MHWPICILVGWHVLNMLPCPRGAFLVDHNTLSPLSVLRHRHVLRKIVSTVT